MNETGPSMTLRQLDQEMELESLLPHDCQMCWWCAQSMPIRTDHVTVCSATCAQASIKFWSARINPSSTMSFT